MENRINKTELKLRIFWWSQFEKKIVLFWILEKAAECILVA